MTAALFDILRGPLHAGLVFPNIWLAAALLLLKLFEAWSTNYIVGRKGGTETATLATWCIEWTGSVKGGLALDFVLVAACGWFAYPYWPLIGFVVAVYVYWMARQAEEFWKSRPK